MANLVFAATNVDGVMVFNTTPHPITFGVGKVPLRYQPLYSLTPLLQRKWYQMRTVLNLSALFSKAMMKGMPSLLQ